MSQMALATKEQHAMSPLEMVQSAIERGLDPAALKQLMDLSERWQANQARVAYESAMSAAQSEMRVIGTDATNPQTHSRYATYAKLDRALRPIYSKHGLALSFDTGESRSADEVLVLCYVSHVLGHSRTYRIPMPADGKGAKGGDVMTRTHATGAATQYGMRYLLKMIFNVAIGENDDDGNAASPQVSEPELLERLDWIRNCETTAELKAAFEQSYKWAREAGDQKAMRLLAETKDAKKKELK